MEIDMKRIVIAAAIVVMGAGLPGRADAEIVIGTTSIVVTNDAQVVQSVITIGGASGPPTFPGSASRPAAFAIGGLTFNGIATASDPGTAVNSSVGSLLALAATAINNSTVPFTAHIVISATGFTAPVPTSLLESLSGTLAGDAGSSVVARWYVNPTNQLANATGTLGASNYAFNANGSVQVGPGAGPFVKPDGPALTFGYGDSAAVAGVVSPYGMTLALDVRLTPGAVLTLADFSALALSTTTAVPEPSSLALALVGLVATAVVARRHGRRG